MGEVKIKMLIDKTKLDELVDKYKKELESVEPKYHNEFIEFVETGEASEEFHKYVDNNKQCQEAIDKILYRQAEATREFGKMLKKPADWVNDKLDELVDKYKKELELVEPKYHNEFIEFTEKGEASQEFMDYLEQNKQAQKAVKMVFDKQIKNLNKKAKKLEKQDKRKRGLGNIIAGVIFGVSVAAIGTVGVMGYLANRDGQEAKFSLYQNACLNVKEEVTNIAKTHQDKTMQLLLEKGDWCSGQSYDDIKTLQRDMELLKVYWKYKK